MIYAGVKRQSVSKSHASTMKVVSEPAADGKKLSHWLRRIDVTASDQDNELAAAAIRSIGQAAIPFLIERLRQGGRFSGRAARAFRVLGSDAVSAVPEIQSNPGPDPSSAAFALAGIGGPAFEALRSFLSKDDPMVRSAGAEGISQALIDGKISINQAQETLPQLIENTRNPHPSVRARSASAIGDIRYRPSLSLPALIACLGDHAYLVQCSAAQAIGCFGPEAQAAVPKLIDLTKSSDEPTRSSSIAALAKTGSAEAFEIVKATVTAKNITERIAAINGLGYFAERATEVIPIVLQALDEGCTTCKWNALRALGRLGPLAKSALPAIRRWESRPGEVGGEATLRLAIEQIEGSTASKQTGQ